MKTTVLSKLFSLLHIPCDDNRIIQGISDDSREVEKDWIFVCRRGQQNHGSAYIQDVLAKGAVVLCDVPIIKKDVYICEHVEFIIQALLELYYGDVCSQVQIIGVTGTSGKTSVASYISQLLTMHGYANLRIGTHETVWPTYKEETINTTPGCFVLANYIRKAIKKGIMYIVMEVSSHAIDQNRINFLQFDMIVYTNITQDHLDYHLTKTHYRYTKFKLRRYLKPHGAIIYNNDLPYMMELVNLAQHTCISVGCHQAHFTIQNISLFQQGSSFEMQGFYFESKLLSMVNIYNLAEAFIVCRRLHIPYEALQAYTKCIQSVAGRLEVIPHEQYHIWIDYAHTVDALRTLLLFANEVKTNRIILVIGCGGDRDKTKRPLMAQLACELSDIAIFTSDNPRYERNCDILFDMIMKLTSYYEIFENRYYALKHAVAIAEKNDIIIIAGKGNENMQEIRGAFYPFSDSTCIQERLKKEE